MIESHRAQPEQTFMYLILQQITKETNDQVSEGLLNSISRVHRTGEVTEVRSPYGKKSKLEPTDGLTDGPTDLQRDLKSTRLKISGKSKCKVRDLQRDLKQANGLYNIWSMIRLL